MKHLHRFPLLVVLFILTPGSQLRAAEGPEPTPPARRTHAASQAEVPNFALLDYHGKYYELHRTPARAVVLFFTGNGCPIARQSIPKLRELRRKFADQNVVVWMINSYSQDDRASIRKEVSKYPVGSLSVLMDSRQALALSF